MSSIWGRRSVAFSLVEVLVVISIVGLLAGLSTAGVSRAMESGKRAKAKGDLTAIVAAIKAYRQEYGQWPVDKSKMDQASDEFNSWYGPPTQLQQGKDLMKILSASPEDKSGLNPKNVRFLEGPRSDGTFMDPWGNQYSVKMDTNESGGVEYYGVGNQENVRVTVIAVSLGKNKAQEDPDKKTTKTCDDVFSWR